MKLNTKSILGGLSGMAIAVLAAYSINAVDSTALPDLGPGQGRFLTPEQRVARSQQMQTTVQQLLAKQAAGTLTAEEQAWLNQAGQRGGWCVNGLPARYGQNAAFSPRWQQMQQLAVGLRAKQAAGTITTEEQAWLDRFELGRGWCLSGQPGGTAWSLTPEQRAERQQKMQQLLADLRAKKAAGTITIEEQAWLDYVEQAGGMCVNGVPRGGGGRYGAAGLGAGRGLRQGGMGRGGWGRGGGRGPWNHQLAPNQ